MSETLRGNAGNNGSTLRGNPNGGEASQSGTLRGGEMPHEGTLRGNPNGGAPQGGTLRGGEMPQGGTLRGNPNGGEAPQGGTMRGMPQNTPQGTMRGKQTAPGGNPASKPGTKSQKEIKQAPFSEITLGGVTYSVAGVISASTGEAEIYKVGNGGREYALKLYYPGIQPESDVMDALRKASGSGFLVDVIDCGTWMSPQGESRYYEIQPFYSGGDLEPGMMHGDAEALKATALAMLMAIKTSHDHKILHRDIKPQNFMYIDDGHNQLVLTDFGIASTFRTDSRGRMVPLKSRAQFRTKIYAAPEIYSVIDGEIEYDDVKSDYYALGIALMTLWMGEVPFAQYDERALLRIKRGESGSMPVPDDMPADLLQLISGLIVPNPDKRWGFDEFERWLHGENVPVEGSTFIHSNNTATLNFLWSGTKNQTAHSLEELAALMVDDRKLGKQYLYSGKISEALAMAGFPELKAQIDEFVNKTYPKNQEAGLMATAWLLDGDMPFISPDGNELNSLKEIAEDMADNASSYLKEMDRPDSLLYVYFRASGLEYADKFVPIAKKNELKALWQMIFTLDPEAGFPLLDIESDCYCQCEDVDELVDLFSQQPDGCYDDATEGYPGLLYDDAFYMWLSYRDPALAGKIRSKMSLEDNDRGQAYYYIFYLLAPERNYFMEQSSDDFTVEQIGQRLNDDFMRFYVEGRGQEDSDKYSECYNRVIQLTELKGSRLYYYLKSKDVYKDKLDYIEYAFDTDSKDNTRKAGPYNEFIAFFKAVKVLSGGEVFYRFPRSSKTVYDVDELRGVAMSEQREELEDGHLDAWLAVQYQEDPYADLSVEGTYENLLANYTGMLGEINPKMPEFVRTVEAMNTVSDNAAECHSLIRRVKIFRGLWAVLNLLPLLVITLLAVVVGFATAPNPVTLWEAGVAAGAITLFVRFIQIIPPLRKLFRNFLGEKIGEDFFEDHRWLVALFYGFFTMGLVYALANYGTDYGVYIVGGVCLLWAVASYFACIHPYPLMEKQYAPAIHPGEEASVIEPLFYGWKDTDSNRRFDSPTIDLQKTYINCTRAESWALLRNIFWMLVPIALTALIYLSVSPLNGDRARGASAATSEHTETYSADVRTSLNVREAPDANAASLGSFTRGEQFEVISIDGDFAKIKYNDGVGYVNAKYIRKVEADAQPAAAPAKPAPVQQQTVEREATEGVSAPAAAPQPAAEPAPEAPAAPKMYTIRSNYTYVDIYSRESTMAADVVGEIRNGEQFELISTPSARFAKIRYNGRECYIPRDLIVPVE